MQLTIRDAHFGDAAALIELRKELDSVHVKARPDLYAEGYFYDYQEIVSLFSAAKSKVVVATDGKGGSVEAYMVLHTDQAPQSPVIRYPRTFVYIHDLYVSEAYRGQGVGRALMSHAIEYARLMKADALELNVAEFNEQAIALYESMGLRTQNRRMELLLP